jgi:hypothetical protein
MNGLTPAMPQLQYARYEGSEQMPLAGPVRDAHTSFRWVQAADKRVRATLDLPRLPPSRH